MVDQTDTVGRTTPTASQPVRVPWGDWLAQALAHEEQLIAAGAQAGVKLALSAVPFGSFISAFVGPAIVSQYVDMGLKALEGVLEPLGSSVQGGTVLATVANLINANEASFAQFVGANLGPMIESELAKRGITL